MKQFKAKITSNRRIAPDHYILSFTTPKTLKVKPGQFFNVRVSSAYEPLLRRPFGAHRISKGKVEILYKVVGRATEILSTRKKHDILDVLGPLGNGFDVELSKITCQPYTILVAGGHGVAPLYALAERIIKVGCKVLVLIGAKTKDQIVVTKELKNLGAKVHVATEDGSKGYKGLISGLLKKKLSKVGYQPLATMYACGPKPMLKAVSRVAKEHKIICQVSLEEYMACGTGTCLGCAVKTTSEYKMVCKDGPVFNSEEIKWQT